MPLIPYKTLPAYSFPSCLPAQLLDPFDLATGGFEGVVGILRRDAGSQAMHLAAVAD